MAKLLICDDSLFQRRKLKHLFEEQGHEVTVAEDGEDALQKVESATPDLLLCDLLMPTLDGFGVLERLQAAGSTLPVIVVSADVQHSTVTRVRELGAKGFLNKPADPAKLIEAVNTLLQRMPACAETN